MGKKDICNNSSVSVREDGAEIVVSIIGNFDNSTTPLIHECCKKVKDRKGVRRIILDFGKVLKADTSAFACIISFIKEHMGTDVEINITNLREPEEGLMRMLKLEKMVKAV
jgi:anti-anti-sigma factor